MTVLTRDPLPQEDATRPRARRRTLWRERIALAFPAAVAAMVTLWWFPFDKFMAAGDITPFVRDGTAHELFALWNHRSTGTGGTSAPVARLFEVVLIRATGWFGGSEMVAQHLQYALIMGLAGFGVAYLARAFVRDPIVVAVAGLLGVFNPFVLVHLPNLLPVLWLGVVAVLSGMILRAARGTPVPPLAFAGVSLLGSYLSVNPPLLATAVLAILAATIAASLLVGPGGTRRASRFLLHAIPWAVAFNLWWLVPTVIATVHREGVTLSAQTRVQDWSWSHAQNSLTNIVALKADWGWKFPEYSPYAKALDTPPWAWLRWILPGLALAAPFLTRGRQRAAAFTLLGGSAAVVVAAKGLHAPLPGFNLWLYQHVPGFWLLREPMSKVGGALVIAEVLLAAFTLSALAHRLSHRSLRHQALGGGLLVVGLCLALLFPFPIWSGAIGSDGKHGLPTPEVAVPSAWRTVATTINASARTGKVLVLPLDRYYQVTTDWGFHGADELVQQLVRRPVLQLLPDGYFSPGGDAAAIMKGIESNLLEGRGDRALNLARSLGVSEVLVRTDVLPSDTVPRRADVGSLVAAIEKTPGFGFPERFGVANLYTVKGGGALVHAPRRIVGLRRETVDARVEAMGDLGRDAVAVDPTALPIDQLSWATSEQRSETLGFRLRHRGRYDAGLDDPKPRSWDMDVTTVDDQSRFELSDPMTVVLDGERVPTAPSMSFPIAGGQVDVVDVDGSLTPRTNRDDRLTLDAPATVTAYRDAASSSSTIRRGADFCGAAPAGAHRPRAVPIPQGVRLHADAGLGCVTVPGPTLAPDGVYRIHLETRTKSSAAPRICVWARGPDRCLAVPQPPATFGWVPYDVGLRTPPGTTGLILYLYADAGTGPATIEYRAPRIAPQQAVGRARLTPTVRPRQVRDLAAGRHELTVAGARTSVALRADTPLGDCQHSDDRSAREAGLEATTIRDGVRLAARAHSACVSVPIPDAVAGQTLDLGLQLRAVSGRRPRICVWQDGPNVCADIDPLPTGSGWSSYTTKTRLVPGTTGARIYLYADGQTDPGTVAEYRRLAVRAAAPDLVHVDPRSPLPPAPKITWQEHGPESISARSRNATSPYLLVMDDSFANGWKVSGAPAEAHRPVNGYANGWYIDPAHPASISISYGPARAVRWAYWISALALLGAAGLLVFRANRRRAARRHPDTAPPV